MFELIEDHNLLSVKLAMPDQDTGTGNEDSDDDDTTGV